MDEAVKRCLERYRSLKADSEAQKREGLHDYSLIASMLKPSDEVNLHSRFTFSMLDPKGSHYQGAAFLKLFLDQLPGRLPLSFNLQRAKVFREKDRIDLLIHDGEHAIIIENKIHASDQRYQITRYIGCVQRMLFPDKRNLSDRVAVVYLSAKRKQPSAESHSLIGFSLSEGMLCWDGTFDAGSHPDLKYPPDLEVGVKIPFHHFPYFPSLQRWAECCAEAAPPGGIRHAFEEYRLVLERLRKPRSWRKIMNLDGYAMTLHDEGQREMYAFMVEAQTALDRFIVTKLFTGLAAIFGEEVLAESGTFSPLNEDSLRDWLAERGNDWKNIGFMLDVSGRQFGFALATKYAYMGFMSQDSLWATDEDKKINRVEGGAVHQLLRTQSDGVFQFLNSIRIKAKGCGVEVGMLQSA